MIPLTPALSQRERENRARVKFSVREGLLAGDGEFPESKCENRPSSISRVSGKLPPASRKVGYTAYSTLPGCDVAVRSRLDWRPGWRPRAWKLVCFAPCGAVILVASWSGVLPAAGYRTQNFVVDAPTPELAREIGDWAEKYRKDLAIEWLGQEMRPWGQPCLLTAQVAPHLGAGGATSFVFEGGEVHGWRMTIQGSQERLLDSVLPHEVTHTVFATHFRQALPRWADEGACTTVEHSSERLKQQQMLISFLKTGRGIAFNQMFAMKEYPQDVMPLYSQGYSLARYLIAHGGKRKFLAFLATGMHDENWPVAVRRHYGHDSLMTLQNTWLEWVRVGSPHIAPPAAATELAATDRRPRPRPI